MTLHLDIQIKPLYVTGIYVTSRLISSQYIIPRSHWMEAHSFIGYCYHSVNDIKKSCSKTDHIQQLLLYNKHYYVKLLNNPKQNLTYLSSFDYESFTGWSNLTSDCKIAKYDDSCDAFSFSTPLEVYQSNCFNVTNQVITIFYIVFKKFW